MGDNLCIRLSFHKDLILGFNTFLPPDYKIRVKVNRQTGDLRAGFRSPGGHYSDFPAYQRAAPKNPTSRANLKKKQGTKSSPKRKDSKRSSGALGLDYPKGFQPRIRKTRISTRRQPWTMTRRKFQENPGMVFGIAGDRYRTRMKQKVIMVLLTNPKVKTEGSRERMSSNVQWDSFTSSRSYSQTSLKCLMTSWIRLAYSEPSRNVSGMYLKPMPFYFDNRRNY